MALASFAFASCQDNASKEGDTTTQAQMDSVAKATEEQARAAQQAANDSLIQAEAKRIADSTHLADSIAAAEKAAADAKAAKAAAPKKTKTTTKTISTPSKVQDQKFDSRANSSTTITKEEKKAQDDKFNRR